jgi:hypothetical protein
MEIEFSPSQLPPARPSSPVDGAPAKPAPSNDTAPPLQGIADLQNKLAQVALTRPDKMAAVEPLVSDVQYPPDELLNGIAHLLAIKLDK